MIDTDLDNLNDAFEIKYGTDTLDDDTDGNGYYDYKFGSCRKF